MTAGETRRERAENEYIVLTLLEGNEVAIQGNSGEAHLVMTSGSDAVDCYCPDKQNRHPDKCKHEIAWEEWLVDELRFSDGDVAWKRDDEA